MSSHTSVSGKSNMLDSVPTEPPVTPLRSYSSVDSA
ncbi:hypothetical protein F441_13234 [Phytophthora nicotianae CJ01A1]|uniref:Uncharacterized protein n=6 Tax=Phytophthora nicotianae TaxID=4792 RepID=W2R4G5_PHYN3|nr:hypothetical protein PPTG_21266 [Phytophthora nicotianae INRA-310]ETI41481.1 hypothetical protein F443_13284 [Phytophthora nicotianae P1569]ETK81518.1 hypothetical protein L915_12981 [Phytophthora nicotianae]ETO70120.1 hypothetical protein F444_13362 [Phytophthora nicotianae P1976]ETP11224.1 hypothetical protein F441_13234 [Phytophthora nicotianae CJ01A1]ETP39367.1 hypothetical protein F442_13154 [Phytophthora nicotianae P10297]